MTHHVMAPQVNACVVANIWTLNLLARHASALHGLGLFLLRTRLILITDYGFHGEFHSLALDL
jgi:hypothetical protein